MGEALETGLKIAGGVAAVVVVAAGVKYVLDKGNSDNKDEPLVKSVSASVDALAFGRHAENKLRTKFDKDEAEKTKDLKEVLAIRAKMASDVGVAQTTTP
jgi:hypothetical protein